MNLLVYIVLCLIWGTTWLGIKVGLEDAPPIWSAALRFILATIILLIVNYFSRQTYPQGWRNKWRIAWPGLFTFFGSYFFTYIGTDYVSSALASILFAVFPFFVMLLMPFMVKNERVDFRSVMGILVGFGGTVLIFAEPMQLGSKALFGMVCLILSPMVSSVGTVAIKAYMRDEPVFPMLALQMSVGAVMLTLAALVFEDIHDFRFTTVSVGAIGYLAVLGSIVTFAGYFWLLKRVKLIVMSMVALITPIVAMFVGYFALSEVLKPVDYVGSALVLAGVLIVNLGKK
jgi:drug/metabolite transporter (DMT)-like permease